MPKRKKPIENREPITFRVRPSLREQIEIAAAAEGLRISEWLRNAVEAAINVR